MQQDGDIHALTLAARAAAAWSERLGVVVTADLVLLGALLGVRPDDRPHAERLVSLARTAP